MRTTLVSLAILVFCSCSAQKPATNAAQDELVVHITSGMLRGVNEGNVDIFRGIPFAAPPVGEFRWRPPQPVTPWEGVRNATEFGPACAQGGCGAAPGTIAEGSSEDCLYLNVWKPAGMQARVPLMIGNNSAEIGGAFVNASISKEELFSMFGELKEEAKAAYDPDGTKDFAEVQTRFNTDKVWGEPARFAAQSVVAKGDPAYIFLFSYVPAGMKERMRFGPGHGTDISFVFDNLRVPEGGTANPEDKEVARIMNGYWVNFARTGNPNGDGLPVWPLYNPKTNQILDVQPDGKPVAKTDPRKAGLDVIEKAVNLGDKLQPNGI